METTRLKVASRAMRELDWANRDVYKQFVSQVYYFVCHSTRMLGAAMSQTSNEKYYDRLVAHIKEEDKHEKLALMDLKQLGGKIEDHPEASITRAMWESQFYKISKSPTSLLGYILALELIACEVYPDVRPLIEKTYGPKCLNFIRVHSDEDPDHVEKALKQLDALTGDEKRLAVENFEQTCDVLTMFFIDINSKGAERSNQRKQNQAA